MTIQVSTAQMIAAFARAIAEGWTWRAEYVATNPDHVKKDSGYAVGNSPNVTVEVDGRRYHSQIGYNAMHVTLPIYDAERRVVGARGLNFFNPPDFVELLGGTINVFEEEVNDGFSMSVTLSEDHSTLILDEIDD